MAVPALATTTVATRCYCDARRVAVVTDPETGDLRALVGCSPIADPLRSAERTVAALADGAPDPRVGRCDAVAAEFRRFLGDGARVSALPEALRPVAERALGAALAARRGKAKLRPKGGRDPVRAGRPDARAVRNALVVEGVQAAMGKAVAVGVYRRSSSRWAGGDHSTVVTVDATLPPTASGSTSRAWSSNGKWKGTNSAHTIRVRPDWRARVLAGPGARVDGHVLLDASPIPLPAGIPGARRAWEVVVVRPARGVDLQTSREVAVEAADPGIDATSGTPRLFRPVRLVTAGDLARGAKAAAKAAAREAKRVADPIVAETAARREEKRRSAAAEVRS